jgi:hypothetical protein
MDIQTHIIKDTRKVCSSRDRHTGEWISQVTTVTKNQLDYLNQESKIEGIITDIDKDVIVITDLTNSQEYLSESFESMLKIGDRVAFIHVNNIAADIVRIG